MFYLIEVEDYIRVSPKFFGLETKEAIQKELDESYKSHYFKELGQVLSVIEISKISEGIVIPEDGAAYYNSQFKLLVWKPELQELIYGIISEISSFGAFINLGELKGMIHISQTMEDYVSVNKSGTLSGKSTRRSLGQGDDCMARIVAISFKAGEPKIGLTMRQPGLGKLEWIEEDKRKKEKSLKQAESKAKGKKGGRR